MYEDQSGEFVFYPLSPNIHIQILQTGLFIIIIIIIIIFFFFYLIQYLSRGIQFSRASLNGALVFIHFLKESVKRIW